jgi:predicted enzyme related to lactoylglutathione lyase
MTNTGNTGRFVWYEDLAKDPKAAIDFYTDVVGWKTQPFAEGGGDYTMWVGSQGPLGGVMRLPDEASRQGIPAHWMAHVQVANVDETAALAKKLGGSVHKEPTDIPTVGRFAVIGDPQKAFISIFTPSSPMTLHDTSKPGEFVWNELMTSDAAGALKFYSQLFGWKILREMDMGDIGTYRIFGLGDKQMGGIMNTPKGVPPMWIYYAETPDLDAALTRAKKRGAKVLNGPMDVPGGGRVAQITDPQGAAFALHQAA